MTRQRLKSRITFVVQWCFLLLLPVRTTGEELPQDMHQWAIAAIEHVFKEDFRHAEVEAKRIIRKYPSHPAGYFFLAAVLDYHMAYLQSNTFEAEFYQNCDLAISKGEKALEKQPDDPWIRFFVGGACGAKGTYESRYHRWITAFRNGWQGVVHLKKLAESRPGMVDVLYGLAVYDYWRSAMMKKLWWMPGVEDKRVEAMADLKVVGKSGIYVRYPAAAELVAVLNNEKKYREALVTADRLLEKFPGNLGISRLKADALFGVGNYDQLSQLLETMARSISAARFETETNQALLLFQQARLLLATGKNQKCQNVCDRFLNLKLPDVEKKRLEEMYEEVKDMRRKAR